MDIKKSNFLKDRFELSSFILKIYNVNAGPQRCEKPLNSQSEARLYYVNVIYALGSAHVKIEIDLLPFYSTSSVE